MTTSEQCVLGGCLCGALRYAASGTPIFAGLCFCADCRKASGSGFIPFMGFPDASVHVQGETRQFQRVAESGRTYVRSFCHVCGSLVFGRGLGDGWYNIYAGSLDDPTLFRPVTAIYTCSRVPWAGLPPGLETHEKLPG